MHVERSMRGDITVIALIGDLDAVTASQVQTEFGFLAPDRGRLLLDLSRVSTRSSLSLRLLLLLYRQARQQRLKMAFACVPPDLHAVMSSTGFLRGLLVADTVDDGLEALRQ